MTEAQFRDEQRRMISQLANQIKDQLFEKAEKAFKSGAIPDEWKTLNDFRTAKAVVDSFCREREFQPINTVDRSDFDNLHLFI